MDRERPSPLDLVLGLLRLAVVSGLMLGALVWAAGTTDWPRAFWCIGLLFAGLAASVLVLWRVNPEVIVIRRRFGKGTRPWDFLMIAILVVSTGLELHVAGFDERQNLTSMPEWLAVAGNLVMLMGIAGITWAQSVNRHFEPSVRIQHDRNHAVVERGPYAIVRHPGYAAGALILVGMAVALGSLWALLPAALAVASLAVRAVLEESVLRAELVGYDDYARRVKHRLVPGIW
jgi:protein-S-isoprenylcysteine O-methyltransferase Ste14